jgi:hypothetical protein
MGEVNMHLNMTMSAMTVSSFLKALNTYDYEGAGEFISNDMRFEGVLGSVNGKKKYLGQMAKMKFRYDVKKLLYDEETVSVLYEIQMGRKTVLASGWYEVREGLITHIRVIFDPRAML